MVDTGARRGTGGMGPPPAFSDAAMQVRLSINVLFMLPMRPTAGVVASLLKLAGLGVVRCLTSPPHAAGRRSWVCISPFAAGMAR